MSRSLWTSLVIYFALAAPARPPAQRPHPFHAAPRAAWIAPPNIPGDSFLVFHARRAFALTSVPSHLIVHVSADNRYRLFANGVLVSSGPQRSDLAHWKYETVDLAPHLRPGRSVLAAVIWNWGAARPVAQFSHRTGFLMQGDDSTTAAVVNTGPGWKLLVDSAYAPSSSRTRRWTATTPPCLASLSTARAILGGWESADFDDSRWIAVAPSPRGGAAAPLSAFSVPAGGTIVGRT